MPVVTTQKAFRNLKRPHFCYLCGKPLNDGTTQNTDHCPPLRMFGPPYRANYPLTLPTHLACNNLWSPRDEQLSLLFDMFHGREK